ncbi:cell division protein ZapE [Nocardia sp. R6R-6]|uniref:cell division protein ZapE n=1 Tax=Nocardia sp. R6R-6 TaxID=3459303 RepID=UPI00403DF533
MKTDVIQWDCDQARAAARLRELLDQRGKPIRCRRGVYLHGGPGRGKTMLMNRFFAEVNSERKRRYHFHQFFARLHVAVRESGSIDAALAALLGDARLICFDEFHAHDIGDAMLIARLLDALFAHRVVLVVTSNYAPHELLSNPLFHDRFVPSIERILARMDVVSVDGPVDYRMLNSRTHSRTGFAAGRYIVAPGRYTSCGAEAALFRGAEDADGGQPVNGSAVEIVIGARRFRAIAADGVLAVDFADLCGAPTSAADYIELAQRFQRWEIRDVPLLSEVPPDHVMRFVNVIDVLYDADCELMLVAPVPVGELVRDVRGVPDIARLQSRLCALSRSGPAVTR